MATQETKQGHAPTPWKASGKIIKGNTCRDSSKVTIARVDSRGKFVPGCDEANAEFIVRACNAHDDLLEALKALYGTAVVVDCQNKEQYDHPCGFAPTLLEQARAAMAKATEKGE